jgi:hypothetical protein
VAIYTPVLKDPGFIVAREDGGRYTVLKKTIF